MELTVSFAGQSEAKRFIVERVLQQAEVDGVALSQAERHMLSWSESDPGFTRDFVLAEDLGRQMSDDEYEAKIADLIRSAFERDVASDSEARSRYRDANAKLGHYISVMMQRALGSKLRRWWFR